jgi:glycosyltransferase involved in cell wall biosynthesis
MKYISICIPTYEMHGKGPGFLRESFERLVTQTFKDFDVVISDNSITDVIKVVCDEYADKLDIKYHQNADPKKGMSSNTNNAIRMATGKIVKMVAQNFDLENDHGLVTGCTHTYDGREYFNPHLARYNDRIHVGKNTIGSPSVLAIKNDDPLYFDTELKWLMDCDYYKRMHDAYGEPKIVNEIGVVIRTGDHQVTSTEVDKVLVARERAYVEQKERAKKVQAPVRLPNVTLVAVSGINSNSAQEAMKLSLLGINYGKAVLISHEPPLHSDERIQFKKCKPTELMSRDPKNTDDYSRFMAYELANYIDTEFALIVHHNAHVLYPHKWDPGFLGYDYIGAPWPKDAHHTKDGAEVRVGNGGFSLRSKRLLNILNELGLPFTDNGTGYFHEDGIICVYYRQELEAAGIRFAPADVAARFSHELDVPESVAEPFGFHDYKTTSRFKRVDKLIRKIRRIFI